MPIYIVVMNPCDSMAMICKRFTKADFVISTGINLESIRFRSRLAEELKVPVYAIQRFVAGEHCEKVFPYGL